jgi:hypothetical protein
LPQITAPAARHRHAGERTGALAPAHRAIDRTRLAPGTIEIGDHDRVQFAVQSPLAFETGLQRVDRACPAGGDAAGERGGRGVGIDTHRGRAPVRDGAA